MPVVTLLLPYHIQPSRSLLCVTGTCMLWPDRLLNTPEWGQPRVRLKWNGWLSSALILHGVRRGRSFYGILWLMNRCFMASCFASHCKTWRIWGSWQLGAPQINILVESKQFYYYFLALKDLNSSFCSIQQNQLLFFWGQCFLGKPLQKQYPKGGVVLLRNVMTLLPVKSSHF